MPEVPSAIMPTYGRLPVSFSRGEGAILYDTDNRPYLDGVSGIAVTNLGHQHPQVTAAIIEQAKTQASKEAASILEAAKKEAETEMLKLRDQLRKDVSLLAVHGAEEILKKEVDQAKHNDILKRLEAEL